ncbi:MAG: hypothetical protein KW793_03490 [Candidatus Doudnabacteria bacterium]|nr:hypothetical protein [Candidatus Doudnabacteria bacterium]
MLTLSADEFKKKYGEAGASAFSPAKDISKYPQNAQQSIQGGLKTGNVRFEENDTGGEYIYSGDKSFGNKPNYLSRVTDTVGEDINNRVNRVANIQASRQSPLMKGFQTFGQGLGLAATAGETAVNEIPGVKQVTQGVGEGLNWLASSKFSPLHHVGEWIGKSKALQGAVSLYDSDQEFKDTVDAAANFIRLGGDVDAAVSSVNFVKNVTSKLLRTAPNPSDALRAQNEQTAVQIRNDKLLNAEDKVLSNKELNDLTVPYNKSNPSSVNVPGEAPVPPPVTSTTVEGSGSSRFARGVARDVVPTADRVVNHEVTGALDLTQGDVKNIHLSTGNDVGQWIADRNLIGLNKESTLKSIKDFYKENYQAVRSEINSVKATYDPVEIPRYSEALRSIKQKITGVPGLQEANAEVDILLKKPRPTLADAQRVKELMDDHFNLYKATGDVGEGVQKTGLANIRKDLRQWIETEVKDRTGVNIKELNNNVATSRSISDAIETRATRGLTRSNLRIGDLGAFGIGFGFGGPLVGAAAVLGKRIIESPTFRLRFARIIDGFSDATKARVAGEFEKGIVPREVQSLLNDSSKSSSAAKVSTTQPNIPPSTLNTNESIPNSTINRGNTQAGFINPEAMIKSAKNFLKKAPEYGLLKDMSEYTNTFYARKLDPLFEADLRDVLAKYDPKIATLPSGKLAEQIGIILDEAKFKEIK